MEKSSVRESHNDSAGQEVPTFLWNMSTHYPDHTNQTQNFSDYQHPLSAIYEASAWKKHAILVLVVKFESGGSLLTFEGMQLPPFLGQKNKTSMGKSNPDMGKGIPE